MKVIDADKLISALDARYAEAIEQIGDGTNPPLAMTDIILMLIECAEAATVEAGAVIILSSDTESKNEFLPLVDREEFSGQIPPIC